MIGTARLIKWILIFAMPFLLGFAAIRGVIAWNYPAWEYGRIPPDQYGWEPADRLRLAEATLDYIRRPESAAESIHLLEALRLPEDPDQPLFNEREIGHMLDVKIATDQIQNILWVLAVLTLFSLLFFLTQGELRREAYDLLYRGGLATIIALAGIGAFVVIGWQTFFVLFHELLFPPGTWTFFYTDSLIRLFPEVFWFDVGVLIVSLTLVAGLLLTLAGYLLRRSGASEHR